MLLGGMQDWPLRVSTIIDHAATYHPEREGGCKHRKSLAALQAAGQL